MEKTTEFVLVAFFDEQGNLLRLAIRGVTIPGAGYDNLAELESVLKQIGEAGGLVPVWDKSYDPPIVVALTLAGPDAFRSAE